MKLLSKITVALSALVLGATVASMPVKAATNEEMFLKAQMSQQLIENAKIQEYAKLRSEISKVEKRQISEIENVKMQAMSGIAQGNLALLDIANINLACGQPSGEYYIATMDRDAYNAYVAGMAELERIKKDAWMTYTFRTH